MTKYSKGGSKRVHKQNYFYYHASTMASEMHMNRTKDFIEWKHMQLSREAQEEKNVPAKQKKLTKVSEHLQVHLKNSGSGSAVNSRNDCSSRNHLRTAFPLQSKLPF